MVSVKWDVLKWLIAEGIRVLYILGGVAAWILGMIEEKMFPGVALVFVALLMWLMAIYGDFELW